MRYFLFVALALTCLAAFSGPASAAGSKPNLIVVLIDDMGWSDLSSFGNEDAKTPAIDSLAAEGLRFRQFYVNAPLCSPSRCALLTGQYPQRWRITSFLNGRVDNERRGVAQWLDPSAPTLARALKSVGYATGHFGKWHLGGQRNVEDAPPITDYGFDQSLTNFEGMGPKLLPLTRKPGDTEPGKIWQEAERLGGPVTWMDRSEITKGYVDATLTFVDEAKKQNKPFYVNVWPDDVHSPFWPPLASWKESKRERYLAVLEAMDQQLKPLFDRIRNDQELRDNTLIVLMSDNGPEVGAGRSAGLRGSKGTLYDGGIRSPLIVWGPGFIDPAKRGAWQEKAVLSAMDVNASLQQLLTGSAPDQSDGEALVATLTGKEDQSRSQPLCWRRPPGREKPDVIPPDLAIREGQWKLTSDYDGNQIALYELETDLGETKDLAKDHPDVVARLKSALLEWNRSLPADRGPELKAELEARK